MECNKPFSLPAVLGAETSAAEDEDHWMLSLQFGELPAFRGVVGKLIVGEDSPWNNVGSHMKSSTVRCASPGCVSMVSTTNASHKHSVPEGATSWARTASASTINARD